VFLNDLLTNFGMHPGLGTYFLGVSLGVALPAWIVYRGITPSTRGALTFLAFETLVVTALCLTVVFVAPSHGLHLSLENFSFAASPDGTSGIFRALIFGMLTFCGFDVISTLSEETHMPRRLIPQATFLALGVFGVFIIAGIWALCYGGSPEKLKAVADAGGMPISEIARDFWGGWASLVPVTAITAGLGIGIATAVGASRVLFSMARRGLVAERLGRVHAKYRVPWGALHLIFATGLVAAVVTGAALGPYNSYVWWGTTSTFFALLTYLMVNVANLLLFTDRAFKSVGGFILHVLIPLFGIAVDLYILIRSFFIELWGQGWATGQSVIVFDVACALGALGLALRRRRGNANGASETPNG
jgi:amino acid transporter